MMARRKAVLELSSYTGTQYKTLTGFDGGTDSDQYAERIGIAKSPLRSIKWFIPERWATEPCEPSRCNPYFAQDRPGMRRR